MQIKELVEEAGETSKSKGFHDKLKTGADGTLGTLLMLITSELSEALEADRNLVTDELMNYNLSILSTIDNEKDYKIFFEKKIKNSFGDEIADAFIRLGDLCYRYNIDIERHIFAKMKYNKTRPHSHNKKY